MENKEFPDKSFIPASRFQQNVFKYDLLPSEVQKKKKKKKLTRCYTVVASLTRDIAIDVFSHFQK